MFFYYIVYLSGTPRIFYFLAIQGIFDLSYQGLEINGYSCGLDAWFIVVKYFL